MSYYQSENVDVFPSTYRKVNITGKLTSEHNFSNILNSITDKKDYILNYGESNKILEVVIHGYYFYIEKFNLENNIKFWIRVENSDNNGLVSFNTTSPTELDIEIDNITNFCGLYISNDPAWNPDSDSEYKYYSLQITDSNGKIIEKNYARLDASSVFVDNEDNLNTELNKKQYELTVKDDRFNVEISEITNKSCNISFNKNTKTLLNSIAKNELGNNGNQLIYSNGAELVNSSVTIGNNDSESLSSKSSFQSVYLKDGVITANHTMYVSNESPKDNTDGENGDIWFKYND